MNKLDPARLDAVFPLALEDPEIKPHVDVTIGRGKLQRAVRESTAVIWDAASEALNAEESAQIAMTGAKESTMMRRDSVMRALIEEADARPEEIAAVVDTVADSVHLTAALAIKPFLPQPQEPGSRKLIGIPLGIFSIGFTAIFIGVLIALLIDLFGDGGWAAFKNAWWLPTAGVVGFSLFAGAIVLSLISSNLNDRAKNRAKPPTIKLLQNVQVLLDQIATEIANADSAIDAVTKRANRDLVSGMVRVLRRAVDAAQADDYSTLLPDIIPRGLAEGYNVQSDLITPSRARLERYLESMPNGSIGIAGSRGAGKSTLLHTFAAKQSIKRKSENGDIDELRVFSVEVSAPVQYDARDFVLHLFSSMCVRVRKSFGDQEGITAAQDAAPDAGKDWQPLLSEIATALMGYTAALAAVLTIVAITAAVSLTQATTASIKENAFANMGIKPVDIALQALIWFAAAMLLYLVKRHTDARLVRVSPTRETPSPEQPPDPILIAARENALVIRYQRSYAADWNIGASFAGLSAGVKQAQSLQEQRLTLPEIVARYREFVSLLAARDVVIVAIDELDKIASDEKAQQFLNDIKALFGIPNCFYLITVSDNAMSSFARRGLPIRDAFDSALDEIVRVEHMDLADAQKLIAGRVIGLPIPYLAFCYCYSGGLPRDLIRSCRDVFEVADRPGRTEPRELAEIGYEIFCEDLASKVKGSITAISALRKGAIATATLDRLQYLEKVAQKQVVSLHDYTDLEALATATTDNDVRGLTMDLASYLYYAMTVLDVLDAHRDDAKHWERSRLLQLFDDLAALRRSIGVESAAAATAISTLRISENLPMPKGVVSFPVPNNAATSSATPLRKHPG